MSHSSSSQPRHSTPTVGDSPWFWLLLFSGMALVALPAIGPKYSQRQGQLDRRYVARENAGRSEDRVLAYPDENLIPLAPLRILAGAACALSGAMLWWGYQKPTRQSTAKEPHNP